MPAYNGGLFDRARAPLLERTRVPDAVMAPIIDALSRRTEDLLRGWINYRDLSVSHLGGIYERLLEYSLVHEVQAVDSYKDTPEINRIVARPASFARKVSGSYYTTTRMTTWCGSSFGNRSACLRASAWTRSRCT